MVLSTRDRAVISQASSFKLGAQNDIFTPYYPQQTMSPNGSQHDIPLQSDLLALSELTPPSPVLSPTELDASCSWSNIQIELDFSIDGEAVQDLSHHNLDRNFGLGILTSSSISTVGTAGTFGPIFKRHKTPGAFNTSDSRHSIILGLSTLEQDVAASRSGSPEDILLSTPVSPHSGSLNRPLTTSRLSAALSDRICTTPSDRTPLLLSRSNSLTLSPGTRSQTHPKNITIDNEGVLRSRMLSNITNTSILPSGSCHDFLLSQSDSCPMSVRPTFQRAALLAGVSDDAPVDAHARRLAVAATLAALEKKCHSEPSTPKCGVPTPEYDLPTNFSAATVEIMIDQEGFRGVLARFKYSGYSVSGHATDGDEHGVAHFRPIKRQVFYFHYAALETSPVVRRITVNGEESWDYVSRQASLCLKTNGVYFVRGNETLSFPAPGEATPMSKLQWRFEYMVNDRRNDASGRVVSDGEKLLTPLSFSCSPLLLHPLQGKRVRLMHVVKKSVIPKLVAEKMEPPGFSAVIKPQIDSRKAPPSPISPYAEIRMRSHKRSATLWIPGNENVVTQSYDNVCKPKPSPRRRRRASSAGEQSQPGSSVLAHARHLSSRNSHFCQNIIPRSHLATMIDTESTPATNPPVSNKTRSDIDEPFYSLSPSPHRHPLRTNVVTK
ncbi:hypothetical protein H2248_001170 [Termitomyces sp. 'cryptogamus']|nr:hypothetical protein H2248_001170 [Termitomyces sp. 'cryptogamus']